MLLARRLGFLEEWDSGFRIQGSEAAKRKEPRASARAAVSHHGTPPSEIALRPEQIVNDPFEPTPVTTRSGRCTNLVLPAVLTLFLSAGIASGSYYATQVERFVPGADVAAGDPQVALGEPSRFTPDPVWGSSVVSMVSPAYLDSQIVKLGTNGSLTVSFAQPITNDASHLYGADLIVFSNGFFVASWPDGAFPGSAEHFANGEGKLEVSSDGINFYAVPGALTNRLFPTQGYVDADPFGSTPGSVLTDFHKPVNPAVTVSDFNGLTFAQAVALYDGSGGGMSVDIGAAIDASGQPAGLSSVSYVRITNLGTSALSIDALSIVPEPVTALLLPLALAAFGLRRTRR